MDDGQLAEGVETGSAPPSATVRAFRSWLGALGPEALTDRERVDLVAEIERLKGTGAAAQARLTHAVRQSREASSAHDAVRSVGAEVALARRQSPTLGDRFVGLARALVDEMPCTMQSLADGSCSERHALLMVQATSVLSLEHRAEVDRRVGPLLARLGVRGAERAARRVAQELDVASVLKRMEDAVRSRRVSVRPAPDGMAYLTVLGPLVDVVGASAALRARARAVATGQAPDEDPAGRAAGAIAADTALRLLSGRAEGGLQPVEVHLVMTDRSLLGTGDHDRSLMEPARIPGHGSLPAPVARAWLRGDPRTRGHGGSFTQDAGTQRSAHPTTTGTGSGTDGRPGTGTGGCGCTRAGSDTPEMSAVWLRRLYTSPDGRDLVAMESRRRLFDGLLRRMLILRDDVCTTPWCEAPIAHADHTTPSRAGGVTSFHSGTGKCERCNYGKEAPGWITTALPAVERDTRVASPRHRVQVRTPVGRVYASEPPPLLGWGTASAPPAVSASASPAISASAPPAVSASASPAISASTVTPAPRAEVTAARARTGRDGAGVREHAGGPARASGAAARRRPSRRRRRDDRDRARLLAPNRLEVARVPYTPHLERQLCRFLT